MTGDRIYCSHNNDQVQKLVCKLILDNFNNAQVEI